MMLTRATTGEDPKGLVKQRAQRDQLRRVLFGGETAWNQSDAGLKT